MHNAPCVRAGFVRWRNTPLIILEAVVGRSRVGCDAVRWQGAPTRRAFARKEKQHSQRAAARLNQVRSALTQMVSVAVRMKTSANAGLPAIGSGQLRFLGSSACTAAQQLAGQPAHLKTPAQRASAGISTHTRQLRMTAGPARPAQKGVISRPILLQGLSCKAPHATAASVSP